MRDLVRELTAWTRAGERFALATVVGVRGSAPRPPGASLAVRADGEVVGSVSGGCVEGAVYELCQEVLASGTGVVETYGISDELAFSVGLTCGGTLEVVVRAVGPTTPGFEAVLRAVADHQPVAVATRLDTAGVGAGEVGAQLVVWPDTTEGTLGDPGLDAAVTDDARGLLAQGQTGTRRYGRHGGRRLDEVGVFLEAFAPRPRMLVFGATDYAAAVARLCRYLGFRVTVCDVRPVFATAKRFPDADEVVCAWPDRYLAEQIAAGEVDDRTAITVLTHDPRYDAPLLAVALRGPAAYVGAMGSRRTHAERLERLREAGLTEDELGRLHSPIGLDLGARTPEETAVSIAAEVIGLRWGGSGRPLREVEGDIHDHRRAGRSARPGDDARSAETWHDARGAETRGTHDW